MRSSPAFLKEAIKTDITSSPNQQQQFSFTFHSITDPFPFKSFKTCLFTSSWSTQVHYPSSRLKTTVTFVTSFIIVPTCLFASRTSTKASLTRTLLQGISSSWCDGPWCPPQTLNQVLKQTQSMITVSLVSRVKQHVELEILD